MKISQIEFLNNQSIMMQAQAMYEANLRHGTQPSEREFQACFTLAKTLMCSENPPKPKLRRVA